MALLSLESNSVARVGYSSPARFTEKIYIGDVDSNGSIGAGGTVLKTDRISITGATSDPGTLVAGDIWYRTDLGKFKFRNASTAVELLDASTAITNPTTKNAGDLLQYDGATWNARGGSGSTRLAGFAVTGNINLNGDLLLDGGSSQDILWSTDGAGDIGATATQRPNNLYVKTLAQIAGFTAVTYDTSGAIALNSVKEAVLNSSTWVSLGSYTWAANELLVSSDLEWRIVLAGSNNAQTYQIVVEYYNGTVWSALTTTVTTTSNGAGIHFKVRLMMNPAENARALVWGQGSTGSPALLQDSNLGSSTFLTTANRGLMVVVRKVSDLYSGYGSGIMRELRGG